MEAVQASFDCSDLEHSMGETRKDVLRLGFDHRLKREFYASVSHQQCRFVGVLRKLNFRELANFWAFLTGMLAEMTVRGVEIEQYIVLW